MPSDWLKIKQARPDVTDYLIHWTRGKVEDGHVVTPFHMLKTIVQCGYLMPSFAPRTRVAITSRNSYFNRQYYVDYIESKGTNNDKEREITGVS